METTQLNSEQTDVKVRTLHEVLDQVDVLVAKAEQIQETAFASKYTEGALIALLQVQSGLLAAINKVPEVL